MSKENVEISSPNKFSAEFRRLLLDFSAEEVLTFSVLASFDLRHSTFVMFAAGGGRIVPIVSPAVVSEPV